VCMGMMTQANICREGVANNKITEERRSHLLSWGLERMKERPGRTRFRGELMQAVSFVAYSVSKLFGTRGKLKDHHQNEDDLLQEFRESKGMQKLMDMPSFQGSRMNWLVEVACAILVNPEVYLD
jgi:hypothetical protein